MAAHAPKASHQGPKIGKELLVGMICLALAAYNLFSKYLSKNPGFEMPVLVTNIALLVSGLLLVTLSFKLHMYKYHASRIF